MPARNIIKQDVAESFYHVYARGASRQPIFLDASDYDFFIELFARYLSRLPRSSLTGLYPHFHDRLELLSFCLMPNHFHLLLYQIEAGAMSAFMRSLLTSYSRYFNHKYQRTGSLFETRYKAVRIQAPSHLEHISRYIHLNPRYWRRYPYSSLRYYTQGGEPEWLAPSRILDLFASRRQYAGFVADYQSQRDILASLKRELANS